MVAAAAAACLLPLNALAADVTWAAAAGTAWLSGTNWGGNIVPSVTDVAVFAANPTSATTGVGINFAGSGTQTVQAVAVTSARNVNLIIGNSATQTGTGTLILTGTTIDGADNVVLRNSGTGSALLSFNAKQGSYSGAASMKLSFDTGTSVPVLSVDRPIDINVMITSSNGFRKIGAGTLGLAANSNGLTGAIFIDAGIAEYAGDLNTAGSFGPSSGTAGLYVADGATFSVPFQPTGGVYRPLFISGSGVGGTGAIATRGYPTYLKPVTLTGHATVRNTTDFSGTDEPIFSQGFQSEGDYDLTLSSPGSNPVFTVQNVLDLNAGRLILDGPQLAMSTTTANSMSGIRVLAGTISGITADDELGANPTTFTPGYLELAGTLTTGGSFAFGSNKGILLGKSGTSATGAFSVSTGGRLSVPGVIADNGGGSDNLLKTGLGTLVLADANTYTGTTTISSGTLVVTTLANGGLPSSIGASSATSTNLVFAPSATLVYTGTGDSTNRSFRTNAFSSSAQILSDGSGPLVWSGSAVTYSSSANSYTIVLGGSNTDSNTFGNPLLDPGSGTASVTKVGAGTWIITGSNTYDGTTTVSGGLLVASGSSALGNAALTINGGRLDLGGGTQVAKAVSVSVASADGDTIGNGSLQGTSYAVSNASGTVTISARLIASGNAGFTKSGTGTAVLTAANTYSGLTTLAAGTLRLAGGNDRILPSGTLAFTGDGTLDVTNTSQTFAGMTTPDSPAAVVLTGSVGAFTVASGSLQIGPGALMSATDVVTVDMSSLGSFSFVSATSAFRVGPKLGATNSGSIGQIATATLAATNSITASLLAVGDVGASNDGGGSTLALGQANTLSTGTINVGGGGRNDATLQFRAGLSSPSVTIRGTNGSAALDSWVVGIVNTASNATQKTFSATVDLSAGSTDASVTSMQVAAAELSGTNRAGISNASVTLGSGTFAVGTLTIGRIAASGSVTIGGTAAANGTFTLANAAGSVFADSIVLAENAYLGGTAAPRTVSGTLAIGAGTLRAASIARGSQAGNATASATLAWTSGTLGNKAGGNLTVNSVPMSLLAGSHVFDATGTNSITIDTQSPLSGVGGFVKQGTGLLALAGANSYAGTTTISAGTLRIDGNQAAATGSVSVAASAVLSGTGTIGGATTVFGTHAPGSSPGLQTFAGGLAYAAGSSLVWELSANTADAAQRGVLFDGIDLITSGTLSIDPAATLRLVFNAPLANGTPSIVDWDDPFWGANHIWRLIDLASPVVWDEILFTSLSVGNDAAGDSIMLLRPEARFELMASGGDLLVAYMVPEPSSVALLVASAVCVAAVGWGRSRRRSIGGSRPRTASDDV